MSDISSISEFLLEAGTDYRIVDMGRGFQQIDSQTFLEIENGQRTPDNPRQQCLWLGILFWNKNLSQQHYIWFIKLPVDEQGLIVAAQRDHFLQIIIEALGIEMLQSEEQKQLPENPFVFTPGQAQLADFNSLARQLLQLPPGQYYSAAKNYIARPDITDWQTIAVQGLSDVSCRLNLDHNAQHITQQFANYHPEVQKSLLASLENVAKPAELQTFLLNTLKSVAPDAALFNPLLRSLTGTALQDELRENLAVMMQQGLSSSDHLIVIAGRHWSLLQDYQFLTLFLEEAARMNLFAALYADVVQIPSLRLQVLKRLRDPQRSELLANGLDQLFKREN